MIGNEEIASFLIKSGAILKDDNFGNNPIHEAKTNNNPKIVDLLSSIRLESNVFLNDD